MAETAKLDSLKLNIMTREQYDTAFAAGEIDENQIYMIEGNDSAEDEAKYLLLTGGTMIGSLILNGDPTNELGAATKRYVDAIKDLYVKKTDVISLEQGGTGNTTIVDNVYTTARYRASALVSSETDPTQNGVINWTYE